MQKFLRTMMLLAALALPFASNAQVTADRTYLNQDFSVANPEGWTGGSGQMPTFNATGNPTWMHTAQAMNGLAAGHYYYNLYAPDRYQWLVSPEMDLTESGEAELRFDIALTDFALAGAPATIDSGKVVMVLVRSKANTPGAAWTAWQTLRKWVVNPGEGELDITELTADYTTDTADFAAYLGKFVQVAFYCENTTPRASSVNIHVDNVVVDGKIRAQAPTEAVATEVTATSITLTLTDNLNPVVHHYEVNYQASGETEWQTVQSAGSSKVITINGLAAATRYNFRVCTYVDANTKSEWGASGNAFTHFANPIVPDFAYNFETGAEGWTFVNDTKNGWYLGTEVFASHLDTVTLDAYEAGAFIKATDTVWNEDVIDTTATTWSKANTVIDSSNNVLWVSNDGGQTNAYTNNVAQVSYAYLPVQLEAGEYNISYNWRSKGETGDFDYLRVMLVPEDQTLTAGTMISADITSPIHKNQNTWQDVYHTFPIGSDGIYKMVLMWRNDNSGGTNPPASVDNIVLSRVVCFPVQNLAVVDSLTTAHTVALTWEDPLEVGTYRIVARSAEDTVEHTATVSEMPYVFEGLSRETWYNFAVYTVCGEDNESNPSETVRAQTLPSCFPVTGLAAETTRGSITVSWTDDVNEGASYLVQCIHGTDTVSQEVSETTATFDRLLHSTTYQLRVFSQCVEDTVFASITATTQCAELSEVNCNAYTFNLVDSYGDGWNNGQLRVLVNGVQSGSDMTVASGYNASYSIEFCAGDVVEVQYKSGSYASENSYTVVDPDGTVLFSSGSCTATSSFTTKYSFTATSFMACGNPVMTITVGDRTLNTAAFSWEQPLQTEEADHFEVVVKNALTGAEVLSTEVEDMEYAASGLTHSTVYVAEVTAVYEDGYTVKGTAQFETFGPCNAPINFVATPGLTTINLAWEQEDASVETYKLLVSTSAVEDLTAVDAAEFIAVTGNNGYTVQDLQPSTPYYIYFYADCGANTSAVRTATVTTLPPINCDAPKINVVIAEGTATNEDIPFYGYWLDSYSQHSQSIYPATMLTSLVGKTITSVTYTSTGSTSKTLSGASSTYKMTITEQSDLANGFVDMANVPALYTGSFVAASGKVTITFDEPFVYTGGNLLIEMNAASNTWASMTFKGVDADNASRFEGYSSHAGIKNFLAQLTFATCAEADPNVCAAIDAIEVSDIDYNTATLSWAHPDCHVEGYQLVLSDSAISDFTGIATIDLAADETMYIAAGIAPNAAHYAYVRSICGDAAGDTTAWASVSFETPAYCRVAENVIASVNGKNSALVMWQSTSSTQAANFGYILDTVALDADSLINYGGTIVEGIDTDFVQLENLAYEQTYYVYVRNMCVLDGNNDPAPWSEGFSFTTGKQMPAVVNAEASAYRNTVTATWQSDTTHFADETAWQVAIVKAADEPVALEWTIVNDDSVTFTGLDYETLYSVYVRAYDNGNHSDSVRVQATTGIAMPAVLNLNATVYRNEITATWQRNEAQNAIEEQWQVAIVKTADDADNLAHEWTIVDDDSITFTGLDYETSYRIYVRAYDNGEYSDSVRVQKTTGINMPPVTNIHAMPLSHNYAQINWERGTNAIETQWLFAMKEAADTDDFAYVLIDHMDTMIYGLSELTGYTVSIIAINGDDSSAAQTYNFTTASVASALSACDLQPVDGNDEYQYLPTYTYYRYSLTHTIITADEFGGAKNLTGISYNISRNNTPRTVDIYLMPTTLNEFSDGYNQPLSADAVKVYSGTLGSSTGWNTLQFNAPYMYDGKTNLIVVVDDNTGTYPATTYFRNEIGEYNRSTYVYSDNTNYEPNTSYSGNLTNRRPAMKFCYEGQYIQELAVENITETSAEASWMPGGYETEWQYVNAEGAMTDAELDAAEKTTVTEHNVAINGLTADVDYTFYVRAHEIRDIYTTPMVVAAVDTVYDTTYSKVNPLEMIVTTSYDTTWTAQIDTIAATSETVGAFISDTAWKAETEHVFPTDIDTVNTVWKVAKTHVDTAFNQDWYSDWCKVEYRTLMTCAEPLYVDYDLDADSAAFIALAMSDSVNFRYALKGSNEYINVPGIADAIYDTIGEEYVYAAEDSIFVDDVFDHIAEGAVADTVYTIDTTEYFYVIVNGLTSSTTYVLQAQSVCDEENMSRWSDAIEFTTPYLCDGGVELPYAENFDAASITAACWNVVSIDTFEYEAEIAGGKLYPASTSEDISADVVYDRYVISPAFTSTEEVVWYTKVVAAGYNTYYQGTWRDSVIMGYSMTDNDVESFIWLDTVAPYYENSSPAGNMREREFILPAEAKYVAYHFKGEKPDWMYLDDVDLHVRNAYAVNVYNANATMGDVIFAVDDDTLDVAANYAETVAEAKTVALSAKANDGYRFINWEVVDADNHRVVATSNTNLSFVATDTLLIANFAINEATVKVAAAPNSCGTVKISSHNDTAQFKAATGTTFTLAADDTNANDNMVFRGWSLNNNANNIVSYENPYTFDLVAMSNNATYTYTAMFVQDSFNVVVNYNEEMGVVKVNGRTVVNDNINLGLSDTGAIHMVATVEHGYEFVNWTDAAGEVITADMSFDTASHGAVALEFNANFQTVPFYVQVASNDINRGTATVDTNAAQYLDTVTFTAEPVEGTHSHFLFWKDLVNGTIYSENPMEYVMVEDANMMAFFDIDSHYVKVVSDIDNFGYVTINGEQADSMLFPYGTQGIVIEAMPNTGVAFTAWNDGNTGNPRTLGALEFDTTFTATFDSIDYQIAIVVNEVEGSVAAGVNTGRYQDTLTFVATANPGYRFVDWADAEENHYSGDTLRYVVTAAEQQAVMANFAEAGKVNMNLVANIIEAGTVTAYGQSTIEGVATDTNSSDGYSRFDSLSTVTIVAVPAEHYHFLRWEGADEFVSENDTVVIEEVFGDAMTYTAYFEIDTVLVKGIAENGSYLFNGVAKAGDSLYVNYGTTVNVTPVPAANYHFLAWADEYEDTVRSIVAENDITVEALFEIDSNSVTPAVNVEGRGTVEMAEGYKSVDETGAYWYNYGEIATMTAIAETGYHFTNWSTGAETETIEQPVYGNDIITANFDTNVYNVTFVAENGSIEGPATAKHFTTVQYVAVPDYGYHFASWTNELSETDTAELSAVSDTTIEALFERNEYTVVVEANDATLGTVSEPATALYQETVVLYATAAEGYHVAGWSNGMTGDTIEVVVNGNDTITVNFAINVYNVVATANIAERGTVTGAAATEHGANDTLVATANYGYHFAGWNNGVTTDTLVLTVVSDTNVIANFDRNAYAAAVTFDVTMGTATVSSAAPLYLDTVVYKAVANENYSFIGWSNGLTEDSIAVVITSDTTLEALFEANVYTVSVSSANATMGTVTPAGDSSVVAGTQFTATATANDGYVFVAWLSGNDTVSTTAAYTFTVNANTAIVAHFTTAPVTTYTITLTSANTTMGTVSNSGTVAEGESFTATATANSGYHFVAWLEGTDTVSTDASYTFTVNANRTLVAHFAANAVYYTVAVETNDATMGTVTGGGQFEEGTVAVVIATENAGYEFVEWRNGTQVVSTSKRYEFTVNANVTLTAVFRAKTGIDDIDMNNVTIYSTDSKIIVRGAENNSIYIYDVNGREVTREANATENVEFRMSSTGVYLVKVGNAPAKRVLVVR